MPPPIGDFISDAVYEGQLRSNPDHEVQENTCWFIDVEHSIEQRNGTSWQVRAVKYFLKYLLSIIFRIRQK